MHIAPSGATYAVTHAYRVGLLGRLMGLTKDDAGNYYYATSCWPCSEECSELEYRWPLRVEHSQLKTEATLCPARGSASRNSAQPLPFCRRAGRLRLQRPAATTKGSERAAAEGRPFSEA